MLNQTEKIPIEKPSSYMDFLPASYRQGEKEGEPLFLGSFLKIFEKILSGINDDVKAEEAVGIEKIIDKIHDYFDPLFTPPIYETREYITDFISYLAKWVALSLDENWGEEAQRRLLKKIVPLYKRRGTKEGISEYLNIFVGPNISVDDFLQGIVVGQNSTIGINTFVGGLLPYFFIVTIEFESITRLGFVKDTVRATKTILDLEKPSHTYYALRFKFPGIIVGERSTVALDTIIGSQFPVFV
ncbi:MAG: hypothetical protein GY797_10315 [Deltaproteobacteria bacterium]|nr:hypothetical protein [Deltaproteobacteria bacterium]